MGKAGTPWALHTHCSLPAVCTVLHEMRQRSPDPRFCPVPRRMLNGGERALTKSVLMRHPLALAAPRSSRLCQSKNANGLGGRARRPAGLWISNEASNPHTQAVLCVCLRL